jgi:hypothetical protein
VIRRFYILPLKPGVGESKREELVDVLNDADRFIPGLLDSSAGLALEGATVVWEMNFVSEEYYAGPYMTHPYHVVALDNVVTLGDRGSFTFRYRVADDAPRTEKGIRRIVLLYLADGADTSRLEALAGEAEHMELSVFSPDNVTGYVSIRKSPTHVWEQSFADIAALRRHLDTPAGSACSDVESLGRLGVEADDVKIFTYPFSIGPRQPPAQPEPEAGPILMAMTGRVDHADLGAFVALLESHHDPVMAEGGVDLVHRWRTVENAQSFAEVLSIYRMESADGFPRAITRTHPLYHEFFARADGLLLGEIERRYFYA